MNFSFFDIALTHMGANALQKDKQENITVETTTKEEKS